MDDFFDLKVSTTTSVTLEVQQEQFGYAKIPNFIEFTCNPKARGGLNTRMEFKS